MQTTAELARPATVIPFDGQIRAIIPTLVPWLAGATLYNHSVERAYPLDPSGYQAKHYGAEEVHERKAVKDLLSFLELSLGGRARWEDRPSSSHPSCEVVRADYKGPRWRLTFWDLCGPPAYLQSLPNVQPKIDISYWRGSSY